MATPLREATLTSCCCRKPTELARKVQTELSAAGCPVRFKSGPRKGQACGGRVLFDAVAQCCLCSSNARHSREAYEEPFGEIIRAVIDGVAPEEMERLRAIDGENCGCAAREAEEEAAAAERAVARAKRAAEEESSLLDLPAGEYHVRPDGAAPSGQTWSFRMGEWIDADRFKKRKTE